MSPPRLTAKQWPVYEFIKSYLNRYRIAPYIHEVQTACQIRSYKSALDRLVALERKGFIKRAPNKHRGISLTELAPDARTEREGLPAGVQATVSHGASQEVDGPSGRVEPVQSGLEQLTP